MTVLQTLITRGDAAHTFGPPDHLETVETDTAMLFFLGDHVYKLKRPVHGRSVDFTTRENRLAACEAEVRLNRRLAPDICLGVADIRDDRGELRDHMVVMRRLPARCRLSTLIRQGESVDEPLRALARQLADFH
jgi:aminoglycoside phosphotransferase family enzyme